MDVYCFILVKLFGFNYDKAAEAIKHMLLAGYYPIKFLTRDVAESKLEATIPVIQVLTQVEGILAIEEVDVGCQEKKE